MPISVSRLKDVWPWLAEAKYFWFGAAVICVALFASLRPHTPEPVIRLTGLVLQLLGLGTVIWGIHETRTLFGHPPFTKKAISWLGRFPLFRRNIVLSAAGGSFSVATCKARGHVTHGAGENPSLEDRVKALEKNITLIHGRISETQKEMDDEFRKAAAALKSEEQSRQAEDNTIREKLEATGTGGVHISVIGASWLFVGVILSTAAIEIAKLL